MKQTVNIMEQQNGIKDQCRFYVYVMWRPGYRKYGSNEGSYRGDKFIEKNPEAALMLRRLINRFIIKTDLFVKQKYFSLYDTTYPKHHPDRDIIRIREGIVEQNRLKYYEAMLKGFELPKWLKQTQTLSNED